MKSHHTHCWPCLPCMACIRKTCQQFACHACLHVYLSHRLSHKRHACPHLECSLRADDQGLEAGPECGLAAKAHVDGSIRTLEDCNIPTQRRIRKSSDNGGLQRHADSAQREDLKLLDVWDAIYLCITPSNQAISARSGLIRKSRPTSGDSTRYRGKPSAQTCKPPASVSSP